MRVDECAEGHSVSDVLAIIPARTGSKGISYKNFRALAGRSPLTRALDVCHALYQGGLACRVVVSSDVQADDVSPAHTLEFHWHGVGLPVQYLDRQSSLAQDDTPMIAVVQHVLKQIPGPPEQIIVLLQPTQPLRQPQHITAAIELLRSSGADSVVSVVELPKAHSPDLVCEVVLSPGGDTKLRPWPYESCDGTSMRPWSERPTRRQVARSAFIPDGTVYAFYRRNVIWGHLYGGGDRVQPLIIPPEETCALDTLADWAEAERRLSAERR